MRSSRAIVSLKVGPAPTTALGLLAASMGVGTWAQLTGVSNQNAVIGSQTGSSKILIGFSNKATYNPLNDSIEFLGSDHHGATPAMRHVRYTLAPNSWSLIQAAPAVPGIGHGYDHTTANPFNGDLYNTQYGNFIGNIPLHRKVLGGGSFSLVTNLPMNDQNGHGTTWWTGSFTGGSAGAHGFLLVYDGLVGQLRGYDPLAAAVMYTNNSAIPGGTAGAKDTVAAYSAVKNVAVYGGGDAGNSQRLWRLNADGTVTAFSTAIFPSGKSVGILLGVFAADPVTGNFLLLSQGQLWELNPNGSGTWTQQTGSRAPPAAIGTPNNGLGTVIACPMPHGVVAYITQSGETAGNFYLYKHA